jgi:hypothetical protein
MILEGMDVAVPFRESADVCIIGSGPGGAAAAKILSATGKKVIVLEMGGHFGEGDFQSSEEWGFSNLYVQRAGLTTEDLSITVLQGRCVGGSSTINWTTSLRTPEFTLDAWVREHGLDGLSAARLDPYFTRIEKYLNIHAEPEERHNSQNANLLKGARALGYRARASGRNVRECVQLGVCGFGCPAGAKQSVDVTYLQDAANRGASIIADARADTVEVNGNKKIVRGNILERGSGVSRGSFAVDSSVVIVSASATSTPLILGRSGLGGTSGELGRNLTFHKTSAVIGVYDTPQLSWKGIPQSAMCDEFMNDDGRRGGFWVESAPFGPVLASMSLASFGKTHAEGMELLPYISVFIVLVNDTDSGGSVSPTDSGRPSLRYSTGPNDAAYMLRAIATAARMHFAAGARQVMTLHSQPVIMTDPGNIDRSLRRSAWGERRRDVQRTPARHLPHGNRPAVVRRRPTWNDP